MIQRHLERKLRTAAEQYPVVLLTGPRQSGKTTLVRAVFPDHQYFSLEDPDQRAFATQDPRSFLGRFEQAVILDEAQRTPDLFSYIQGIVDRTDRPGQFILTGSQNFLLMERISQSLAGRCAVLHLLPFTRSELRGRPGFDVDSLGKSVSAPEPTPADNLFEVRRLVLLSCFWHKAENPRGLGTASPGVHKGIGDRLARDRWAVLHFAC